MSFSNIFVICLYTETVEVDQFSELATLVLSPCTRRIIGVQYSNNIPLSYYSVYLLWIPSNENNEFDRIISS